jgi:NAD/NADP transhydrogenase alpha subunit
MLPGESSNFLSRNLVNLISLFIKAEQPPRIQLDLSDEIIAGALTTHEGQVRYSRG